MKQIKLAVFDLDGTLVHLEYDFFYQQIARIFPLLGAAVPEKRDIYELVRNHQVFHCIEEARRQELHDRFWEHFDFASRPAARMIPGALGVVEQLVSQGYEVAIATARSEAVEIVRAYLEPAEINQHVSVLSTFSGQSWKDKTQQLLNVCHELKITPGESLMAGDAPGDIISARNAGFALEVGVLSGESAPHILDSLKPHALLEDVLPVPEIIEQYHEAPDRFRRP